MDFEWAENAYSRHFEEVSVGVGTNMVCLPIPTRARYDLGSIYVDGVFCGGQSRLSKVEINLNGNQHLLQYLDDVTHSGRMIVQLGQDIMKVSQICTYIRTGYADKATTVYELKP